MEAEETLKEVRQVEVDGELAYCCPVCNDRPDPRAVYAGAFAGCENDACIVDTYRWWEDD